MKKFLSMALALTMALSLTACGGNSTSTSSSAAPAASSAAASASTSAAASAEASDLKTVEAGKLIMSTNAAFPPYEMTDDSGNYVGIDVEIAQAIADKLGLELVIDNMGFTAALEAAQNGKSDMVMAGVTVTDDRLLVMDFSNS